MVSRFRVVSLHSPFYPSYPHFGLDGPTARDRGNGSYCWKSEIEEVVSKWNMYQEMVMQGFPDAMEQFTNYWQGRIEYVQWIHWQEVRANY